MESCRFCSLHSSSALTTTFLSSFPPRNVGFSEKPLFLQGQVLKFPSNSKRPHKCSTNLTFFNIKAQASGSPKVSPKKSSKDQNLAFVAGATGRVGSRAVRELLKLGFRVRAGVRSAEKAQALVQSVKEMKADGDTQSVEKLEIVQCDLGKKDRIGPALGNASVVLCCIGASEKDAFDITGPYRIDYLATKNLIEAANVANVDHFILLTSLGTNKVGFPAAILNLFWGVLIWKRKAEEALIASGIPYMIVRPGGMERPTDAFKETHNIKLALEDTLFGGLVSNLQVAELMACIAKNRALSYCKVVEVVAETTAPLIPMEDLLKEIPSKRSGGFPLVDAEVPDLAPPKSEDPKSSAAEEPVKLTETTPRPSPPYTAYEDLKLPTSPTPTPSTTGTTKASVVSEIPKAVVQEEAIKTEVKKTRPSSPFTAYEDLKPPSSPTPTTSGLQKPPPVASSSAEVASPSPAGNDAAQISIDSAAENGPPQISTYCLSPYPAYEDLRPPSSPSPSPPS